MNLHSELHVTDIQREPIRVFTAVPCEWDYGSFGQCSVTCGGGTKSRFPIIIRPAQHGGYCPVHVLNEIPDTVSCNSNPCPGETTAHTVNTSKSTACPVQTT